MAWSYRQDRSDETYSDEPGVTQVSGKKLPETPASPEHGKEMLKKEDENKNKSTEPNPNPVEKSKESK